MDEKFVALKLAEECNELAAILIQYYIFGRKTDSRVAQEMGDVTAWLEKMKEITGPEKVDKAAKEKRAVIRGFESGKIPIVMNP